MLSLSCWLQYDTRYFYLCLHLLGILQLFKSCDPCVSILHLIHEITIYYWPTGWNKNQLKYFNHRWRKCPIVHQRFPSELRTVKYGDFFVCWNFGFFLLNLGVFVIEHCNFSCYQTSCDFKYLRYAGKKQNLPSSSWPSCSEGKRFKAGVNRAFSNDFLNFKTQDTVVKFFIDVCYNLYSRLDWLGVQNCKSVCTWLIHSFVNSFISLGFSHTHTCFSSSVQGLRYLPL